MLAVIASDWLLASRIRKGVAANRLDASAFQHTRRGGSPLGIFFNALRWRRIPETNDLSDPDHIAIRRHYRMHAVLVIVLETLVVLGLLFKFAA
jgi:hypothetical protein